MVLIRLPIESGARCGRCQKCGCFYVGKPPEQLEYTNRAAHAAYKVDTGIEIECLGLAYAYRIGNKVRCAWCAFMLEWIDEDEYYEEEL